MQGLCRTEAYLLHVRHLQDGTGIHNADQQVLERSSASLMVVGSWYVHQKSTSQRHRASMLSSIWDARLLAT